MQPLKSNLKLTLQMLFIIAVLSNQLMAQGLTIGSGTTLTGGSSAITLPGNWSNSGTFTAGTGTVIFNGSGGNQTITKTGGESFYNLTVNKSSGDVQLLSDISVSGTAALTSGDIDLNGKVLSLGTAGTLSETAGNTAKGTSGTITATRTLNNPSSDNVAGMGAEITSTANLGSTSITRGHTVQTGAANSSIKRFYDISPATNTGLSATLVFHYDDSELNGLTESTLKLYRSADTGSTWTEMGSTVNTTNNTVTLNGISAFSRWTLGSTASPLPVELTSFKANVIDNSVILNWETATEVNNYGFEIQRAPVVQNGNNLRGQGTHTGNGDLEGYTAIGFVNGNGNSNSPKNYSFTDENISAGKYNYKLKQIDTDGKFEYSNIVEININKKIPNKFKLSQNYPNPFNPTTVISFSIPEAAKIKLTVYNTLGQKIKTLANGTFAAGIHSVHFNTDNAASAGIYLYRITAVSDNKTFTQVRKMILLK